ncbi:undecaprenyl-diphosphate phosphatase [Kamptonema cortianum]|nr:undecaprenyl-diphosphate phosphatase [Kamptonema cortianum]MDL5046167.1 undecaprenyl-diphosphate phosphatase [Oscillatoria amoena NRMC-F 0135]
MYELIIVPILYGIIEGITEFLPISSTGHLLIAAQFLPPKDDAYLIFIQSGAVIAVAAVFTERIKQLVFHFREKENFDYALKLTVAFVMTGIGGLIMDKLGLELPESIIPVAWALILGGIGFLVIEKWKKNTEHKTEITWTVVVAIIIGQLMAAAFPGLSRSGATIIAALACGLGRPAATEFSFLVGVPTLLAAGAYKMLKEANSSMLEPAYLIDISLATIFSAIFAFLSVKWLLGYVRTHSFAIFAWYRIGMGLLLFVLFFTGWAK